MIRQLWAVIRGIPGELVRRLDAWTARVRARLCGDQTCPCQDGLACNYEDLELPDGSISPAMSREPAPLSLGVDGRVTTPDGRTLKHVWGYVPVRDEHGCPGFDLVFLDPEDVARLIAGPFFLPDKLVEDLHRDLGVEKIPADG